MMDAHTYVKNLANLLHEKGWVVSDGPLLKTYLSNHYDLCDSAVNHVVGCMRAIESLEARRCA